MSKPDLLAEIARFNSQTAGRDKLFRLLQYSSRFIWYVVQKNSTRRDLVTKFQNLEVTFSSGRRLLRLGRFLDGLHSALATIGLPNVPLRLCLTLTRLAYALYMLVDNLVWLHQVGLITIDKDGWYHTANKLWLVSAVAALARDLYEVSELLTLYLGGGGAPALRSRCKQISTLSELGVQFLTVHRSLVLDLVKNFADFWLPYTALGYTGLRPGTIGLLGIISSLAGIMPMFQPSLKLVPS
ncbi:peroxisomal membrane protein 11B-like [Ornithodoros turicata]